MRFVQAAGEKWSAIGLGTWQFGSKEWGYGDAYDDGEAGRIVNKALDLGINFFDTAEIYGRGASERILGQALSGKEAIVASKLFPIAPAPEVVVRHARASLDRLGMEQMDLYQLHWPPPHTPAGYAMKGMRKVLDLHLARHIGVSNHSLKAWIKADRVLGRPAISNQVNFSLAQPKARHSLVPFAEREQRIVIAYSPLAQGYLSGRYTPENRPSGFRSYNPANPLAHPPNFVRAQPLIETLRDIASRHTATPSQVALAWVLGHPNTIAIPGARTVEQLEHNAAAADLVLGPEDLTRIEGVLESIDIRRGRRAVAESLKRVLPFK